MLFTVAFFLGVLQIFSWTDVFYNVKVMYNYIISYSLFLQDC